MERNGKTMSERLSLGQLLYIVARPSRPMLPRYFLPQGQARVIQPNFHLDQW